MLVAGLSVAGALIAFWASGEFSSASGLSQQAVQDVTQYQTVNAEQEGYLNFGSRLTETLQEDTVAESSLYSEAATAWQDNQPAQAQALEARARVVSAEQRALSSGFLCYWPETFASNGSINYDVAALRVWELESPCVQPGEDAASLRTLGDAEANALEDSAAHDRSTAQEIVLTGAFVIAAVFFLTLSYLGRKHRRVGPLGVGVVAVAVAVGVSLVAGLS
jgi:hypothetical protein